MKNLNFTGFLITGIALAMAVICWRMHEKTMAGVLLLLAAIQISILVYNKFKKGKGTKK